jgi:hypothetical protein
MAVAAVIYFVSPFDLIPDAVPVLGLIDDASVIASVARANIAVISSFRKWEVSFRSRGGEFRHEASTTDMFSGLRGKELGHCGSARGFLNIYSCP